MTVRLISADQVAPQRWRNETAKAETAKADTAKADSAIAAWWLGFDPGGAAA